MGRTFSLRGVYFFADNAIPEQKLLLDYVSPDRTKAWKIKEAYIWPSDYRAEIGGTDVRACLAATLWTDQHTIAKTDLSFSAADNRQCAWAMDDYLVRHGGDDFIVPEGGGITTFLIDPDILVTKELYLSAVFTTEATVSPKRNWNYVVVLEEVKVSPSQSLFQQIKGMGQDV